MQAIIRKQVNRKDQGKRSGFRVRGHVVEPEKISRYAKWKKLLEGALLAQSKPVPGDLSALRCERTFLIPENQQPLQTLVVTLPPLQVLRFQIQHPVHKL